MLAQQTLHKETTSIGRYADLYLAELTNNILPFWLRYSKDEKHGGYFTCLDREGNVYDTDKFMWLQGRQVWTFSSLYSTVEARPEWLAMALHGADFMEKFGRRKMVVRWCSPIIFSVIVLRPWALQHWIGPTLKTATKK
jgi:mannose/cellobiose epimerase-like protein (N-acyl-D-glucosamine 2-epimerase family)